MIERDNLDHRVPAVADLEISCTFYQRVLGRQVVTFGAGRKALAFGRQKIHLHLAGQRLNPRHTGPRPALPTCVS